MIWFLRIAFLGVMITMLSVTGWASSSMMFWHTPQAVVLHPWFIATLFDTYFGFLTFWLWLAYRETSWLARILWLIAILLLGNIAMSLYMLLLVWRLPVNASMRDVLLRPNAA
jgi:predicted permease